ncbi:MAG TPA: hypothetical protein VHN79_11420 [Lacunisphaera sp.]|nr:hypothetical protein [Lacunisphaera sp.]
MNPSRALIVLVLVLSAGALGAAAARSGPAESALIRQRIDALLKRRQNPRPLPAEAPNPFSLAGATPISATRESAPVAPSIEAAPPAEEAPNPAELLALFASRLRIAGMIRLKDQVHVIINDSPWKEGDYLIINHNQRIYRLQVMRIQTGQLTLRLDDAELMLRF